MLMAGDTPRATTTSARHRDSDGNRGTCSLRHHRATTVQRRDTLECIYRSIEGAATCRCGAPGSENERRSEECWTGGIARATYRVDATARTGTSSSLERDAAVRARKPSTDLDQVEMRAHQQQVIQTIYGAVGDPSSWFADDFRSWANEVESRRGKLDRKKKVTSKRLETALGLHGSVVALDRFIYAVERYLAARALRAIELCLDVPFSELEEIPASVQTGLVVRNQVSLLLKYCCPLEQEVDDAELREIVFRAANTNFEDHFQAEFMGLVPREVRHAIGSFFTPQWLARHIVRRLGYRHENSENLLRTLCDPACGSGVFLIAAAEELRQAVIAGTIAPELALEQSLTSLHGIDVELVPCLLATASLTIAAKAIAQVGSCQLTRIPTTIRHEDTLDQRSDAIRFDYIVGNPPWVNWEYMPDAYREKHGELWVDLAIFDVRRKTMSFSKEDISALFVAHAIHYRLSGSGAFSFVLPESLFKSTLNHQGFREFRLGRERAPYQVNRLEDFVSVKPFEGVGNRTVVLFGANGAPTTYPIPFIKWSQVVRKVQPVTGTDGLQGQSSDGLAQLADASSPGSSWSTGAGSAIEVHRRLDGENAYRGRTGLFTGGANAIYHLRPLGQLRDGVLHVANVVERAKRPVPQVQASLEDDFIYPFLRGRDVTRWHSTVELAVLLPHTSATKMTPVAPDALQELAPRTLEYFKNFKSILDERRGFSSWEQQYRETGYYSCQRVGDYTFSDWKVAWRYIAPTFTIAAFGPLSFAGMREKPVIPNEKLMLIACASRREAHYLAGVLSASVVVDHIHSRMVSTQISPSIVRGIAVPRFDPENEAHLSISEICDSGHFALSHGDPVGAEAVVRLDRLVSSLWGLSPKDAEHARERNPF